jgi:hypothetical protein
MKYQAINPDLKSAIVNRNCVLFAGAGVSRGVIQKDGKSEEQYLPNWSGLLLLLLRDAANRKQISRVESSRLQRAVDEGKFLFAATAIRKKMGYREFDDALERVFRNPSLKPTDRHQIITRIPFSSIITTNYDKLIETAYTLTGIMPSVYSYDNAPDIITALSQRKFCIIKAHGDIDRKETIVLSQQEYRDMVYRQPGFKAVLNTIFISKTVLFVGSSLNDIDIMLTLETVNESLSAKGPRHFALVPENDIGPEEIGHWRDFYGIQLITYKPTPGHPQVDRFLRSLT